MKTFINKIITIILSISLYSCNLFDKQPLDMISDNVVWNDEGLLEAYLVGVYSEMEFMAHEGNSGDVYWISFVNCLGDEAKDAYTHHSVTTIYKPGLANNTHDPFSKSWCYSTIRKINEFLEKIEGATISEDKKNSFIGRMYFARAFCYFTLVQKYGGVPIIKIAQDVNDPKEELYPKRNTEEDVYNFIISDLNESYKYLPEVNYDLGWPTIYAAYALQSRAALYAGSIAKYGKVQKEGVVGIPYEKADNFFKLSVDASRKIITSKKFKLYNKYTEKAENYRKLFLDETDNTEVIFSKQFTGLNGVYHCWDANEFPNQFSGSASSGVSCVYLEMVESYENIDGTSGELDRDLINNKTWDINELFRNKDPRFHASIFFEGTEWQGKKLENWSGLIKEDGTVINKGVYKNINAVGENASKIQKQNAVTTGFNIKKYCNDEMEQPKAKTSYTDFIIFRYGEILLNYAEALLELDELGNTIEGIDLRTEALSYINEIRERAGIKRLIDSELSIERLRNERKIELAFEGHRYWDLRRWRIAEDAITRSFSGIKTYYDLREPGKFRIQFVDDIDNKPNVFRERDYYYPLTPERIQNNSNLVENPGWE